MIFTLWGRKNNPSKITDSTGNITYQWQVSSNRGASWSNSTASGYATSSISLTIQSYHIGYYYRCKITDSAGHVIYSEPGEIVQATENWSFTYNADGMRTQRTNGTTTYKYTYHNSQLTHMDYNGTELHFSYDALGSPMAVVYGGNTYYYLLNQQGDVIGLVNSSGTQVVTYTYDAWGKPLSITGTMASTLGQYNPLRYRSYVYDLESGLYYLQSRYYNPEIGRFINADSVFDLDGSLQGYNVFLYCANNPTNRIDSLGADSDKVDDLDFVDDELSERGGGGDGFSGGNTPPTKPGKFRDLLKIITGQSGDGQHAHHVFPQKFTLDFQKLGINNHDATFGSWWNASDHLKNSYEYNLWWDAFFKIPGAVASDAFELARYLAELFGFTLNF